ncbi:hypothetical protein FOB41_09220 [Agrobacterium pusense]|uniref:Uncharacterized protein n=1 Tax=Agrobacterium pusense TaxID=648995 RepID=A0A6H0ZKD6_9HYPH|nr:hypothetical protein [Agrobacterium pusense]QIX21302.1 hypothetical protein FOB41_09220 [Agrobacterium pusense]
MEASREEVLAFIPKLEASRQNLVDEIIYESRIQTGKDHKDRNPERLDKFMAELAAVHTAIAAFRDDADSRN